MSWLGSACILYFAVDVVSRIILEASDVPFLSRLDTIRRKEGTMSYHAGASPMWESMWSRGLQQGQVQSIVSVILFYHLLLRFRLDLISLLSCLYLVVWLGLAFNSPKTDTRTHTCVCLYIYIYIYIYHPFKIETC